MRSLLRFWIPWVVGVCVAVFAISLWRKEELDSTLLVTMILGGLIYYYFVIEKAERQLFNL